jgi:SAM-dependent methyltransferase
MRKLSLVKNNNHNKWFSRNKKHILNKMSDKYDEKIDDLIKTNNLKAKNILEIGCSNGYKLIKYKELLKSKNCYGIDVSKKAILDGKKRYKGLKLLNYSSLEINKIKLKFDLVICGFFLYQLDRDYIFQQFDLIYKKLNENGLLLIRDFDPLFKHTNMDFNNKKLNTYKMSYDNFLIESGLFEMIYKIKYKTLTSDKKKFKSDKISYSLFRKIDFKKSYPENI